MDFTILIFIGMGLLIFIFATLQTASHSKKKLRQRLINSFGKDPTHDFDPETWGSVYDYWDRKQAHEKNDRVIDDITWNDLDMDDLFKRLDGCITSIGEEVLFATLHCPHQSTAPLEEREKLITYFSDHPKERLTIQTALTKLGKTNYNDLSSLIYTKLTSPFKNPIIFTILAYLPLIAIPTAFFSPSMAFTLFLGLCILNGILYYSFKREIAKNLGTIKYLSALLRCCNLIFKSPLPSELESFFTKLKNSYAPFKSLGSTLSGVMSGGSSDMDIFAEYIRIVTLYDFKAYNKMIALVSKNQETFHDLYKNIGELDLSIALASFRKSLPYTVNPTFVNDLKVSSKRIYHPLLEDPVPNDILFEKNSLITGSNASGKSTFVKALAINTLLAQTIYTCTAKEFSLGFSLPVTSMAVRDDIMAGDSYFMAEIKSLKRALELTKQYPCLCFIDEILKGTNTIERIAASAAILNYLDREHCLCLIASHDIELTNMLRNSYHNFHFRETITENEIYFDYTLYPGPSQTRNAIALLNYLDFDSKIVNHAVACRAKPKKFTRKVQKKQAIYLNSIIYSLF